MTYRTCYSYCPASSRTLISLGKTTLQNCNDSTHTKIQFDNVAFDLGSEWDTVNYQFEPSRDGYYQVTMQACMQSAAWIAGRYALAEIYINGVRVSSGREDAVANGTYTLTPAIADIVYMETGEYLDFRLWQNRGGAVNILNSAIYVLANIAWVTG